MKRWDLLASCLALFVGLPASGERLLVTSGNGLHSEYRVISRNSFNDEYVKQAGREFVKNKRSMRFAQMYMVTAREHVENLIGTGVSETTFDWIMEKRRRYAAFPVARVLSIGKNAVLQIRDDQGRYIVQVLAGNNPLKFVHSGQPYNIVWVLVTPADKKEHSRHQQQMSAGIFIVAERIPDTRDAMLIWHRMSDIFATEDLSISIRQSPFFVSETFPVTYPFPAIGRPPESEEAYLQQPAISCYPDGTRKLTCF